MKDERKIDLLIKEALNPEIAPGRELNEKIIRMWDEKNSDLQTGNPKSEKGKRVTYMKNRRRASIAAAAAVCVLAVSTTAVAAVKYLTKDEIINEIGNEEIAEAFEGKEALEINKTIEVGDYCFKLYAVATKEELEKEGLQNNSLTKDGTYAVISIERRDGTPMPSTSSEEYLSIDFFVSPLIQGLEPWKYNIASMGGGFSEIEKNGVLYRIIECDDIALFADRRIYLSITDTSFYEKEAYRYNEADGTITRNEEYEGINVLFDLPIDKSRANEEKAADYLKELEETWKAEPLEDNVGENGIAESGSPILDGIVLAEREKGKNVTGINDIPIEDLLTYATLDKDSVKTVTVSADGMGEYTYFTEEGAGVSGETNVDMLFEDKKTGTVLESYSFSDDEVVLVVFTKDETGTVKGMLYTIR